MGMDFEIFDFETKNQIDESNILGSILLDDDNGTHPPMSTAEFNAIADAIILRARRKGNANADNGEALAKDQDGRNSHNVLNLDDDDFIL